VFESRTGQFGSIHLEATKVLVDVCRRLGQRAFVGKVAMDQHGAEEYQETTEQSLRDTEALIEYCHACEAVKEADDGVGRLVNPVVTPRFIPTCSDELLSSLGRLATKYRSKGCWVQSHLAESLDEMAFVDSLHPGERDPAIFREAGLLTDRCIMAHAVHLTVEERALLAETRTGVACCPLSNFFFANGDFPLVRSQEAGVRVGLGTDVAGGYSPSLLTPCRHAVTASKVLSRADGNAVEVDYKRAFWTATIGGAAALGLEDHLGHFEVGKQFDAIVVARDAGVFDSFYADDAARGPREVLAADFERFINLGDDRNVRTVFVRGCRVKGTTC
jgi:guanine deaminase